MKITNYTATVKSVFNDILDIEGEYPSKKFFAHCLRSNGFKVIKIEIKDVADHVNCFTSGTECDWEAARRCYKKYGDFLRFHEVLEEVLDEHHKKHAEFFAKYGLAV